jgi:hypothetical protein
VEVEEGVKMSGWRRRMEELEYRIVPFFKEKKTKRG